MLAGYAIAWLALTLAAGASAGEPKSKPVEAVNLPAVQDVLHVRRGHQDAHRARESLRDCLGGPDIPARSRGKRCERR